MLKRLIMKLILFYQKTLSPDSGWFSYKHPYGFCRYYPNCSTYSYQAIEKYGLFKGVVRALRRLIKCHPFSKGGIDYLK